MSGDEEPGEYEVEAILGVKAFVKEGVLKYQVRLYSDFCCIRYPYFFVVFRNGYRVVQLSGQFYSLMLLLRHLLLNCFQFNMNFKVFCAFE